MQLDTSTACRTRSSGVNFKRLGVIEPGIFWPVLDFFLRGARFSREPGPFLVPQQRQILLAGGMAVGWLWYRTRAVARPIAAVSDARGNRTNAAMG
jgi:hypothetical protein